MAEKHNPKYGGKKKSNGSGAIVAGLILVMAVLVLLSLGLRLLLSSSREPAAPESVTAPEAIPEATPSQEPTVEAAIQATEPEKGPSFWQRLFGGKETEPPATEPPEPEHVVSTAEIAVTGDILMHMPVINTGLQGDGSYNFDSIFRYLTPYVSSADLAVANLETTLAGSDKGYKYSGHPAFNCPDEIVDALKKAGFDLLLTANNHCYDTSEYGFLRTVRTVREKGLQVLGTREQVSESKYTVQEINGIKIGMVNYTYQGLPENPVAGKVYMNKNTLSDTCALLVNSFIEAQPDSFYLEARQCLEEMKAAGAEATVMFIHWGVEYQTTPSASQKQIAQQLCDLGYDLVLGGHPHVIQPVELLTSRLDPEHKTVCLYSSGNAVSNQRISEMNLKTGHTEDALLFRFTFSKYSDGTVYLENVETLPCWVDLRTEPQREYPIIPLDDSQLADWQSLYGLTSEALENAKKSYDRTTTLTGPGTTQVQDYLAAQKQQREADYLAAVTQAA